MAPCVSCPTDVHKAKQQSGPARPISPKLRENKCIDKEKDSEKGIETLSEMSRRVAEADRIDCLTSPDQLSIKAFLYACNKGKLHVGRKGVFMGVIFGLR